MDGSSSPSSQKSQSTQFVGLKRNIVIFEVSSKFHLYRPDTEFIINSLKNHNFTTEVIFYSKEKVQEISKIVTLKADAYISRINIDDLQGDEQIYFDMLDQLVYNGLKGFPTSQTMLSFGSKTVMHELYEAGYIQTPISLYYSEKQLLNGLLDNLKSHDRVIKQAKGSRGHGIWKLHLTNEQRSQEITPYTPIKFVEAFDEKDHFGTIKEFSEKFFEYFEKYQESIPLVDVEYLPRINEGEYRIIMIQKSVTVFMLRKFDYNNEWGTFYKYTYLCNQVGQKIVDPLIECMENKLKYEIPGLWTADFILNDNGYLILSEINSSCVGFFALRDKGVEDKLAQYISKSIEQQYYQARSDNSIEII